ncbi:hypothetical protein EV702DRAFT_56468 [Suillus placidus]|uniref:Uncharacterized protein n=1 Tax=Suillus placidus TaxID=48579 RepID=A0A9P7D5N4_9AGAM|nr:hypothetical protein EV702DRAFT_56468 [Suillus placidus]
MMGSNCLLVGSRQTLHLLAMKPSHFHSICTGSMAIQEYRSIQSDLRPPLFTQAIDAVFTIAIAASYITPIATCFVFKNDFKPGTFSRAVIMSRHSCANFPAQSYRRDRHIVDGLHDHRFLLPFHCTNKWPGDELCNRCP